MRRRERRAPGRHNAGRRRGATGERAHCRGLRELCGLHQVATERHQERTARTTHNSLGRLLQGEDGRVAKRHRSDLQRTRVQNRLRLAAPEQLRGLRGRADRPLSRRGLRRGGRRAPARGYANQGARHRGARAKRLRPARPRRHGEQRSRAQGVRQQAQRQLREEGVPGALAAHQRQARLHGGVR